MKTSKYYSRDNRPKTIAAEPGCRYHDKYEIELDARGHKILVKTGQTNTYEKTQMDLEASKVENILKRYANGDISALAATQGTYIDATEMPSSLAEMQNIMIKAKNHFESLPLEVRAKFNNSVEQFIATVKDFNYHEAAAAAAAEVQQEVKKNGQEQ